MLLKKPQLQRVTAFLWKQATDRSAIHPDRIAKIKRWPWVQVHKENTLIRPVVDDGDIAGILARPWARKHQEQPELRRHKRKRTGRQPLANALEIEHPRFNLAFPHPIANRHHPNTRR